MQQLETLVTEWGKVRHFAKERNWYPRIPGTYVTLCGLDARTDQDLALSFGSYSILTTNERTFYKFPTCRNCARVRAVHDIDTVVPEPNDAARRRATAVKVGTEIEARVFRVAGTQDTYTVTIPLDPYLATLCTCMAGKVHPDKQCKHQIAVLDELIERKELVG